MKPYQERVIEERDGLYERLSKLAAFLGSDLYCMLDGAEQSRLKRQHRAMGEYLFALDERIEAFKEGEEDADSQS